MGQLYLKPSERRDELTHSDPDHSPSIPVYPWNRTKTFNDVEAGQSTREGDQKPDDRTKDGEAEVKDEVSALGVLIV